MTQKLSACLPGGTVPASPNWCGFKVVGDNLDKNVKPRYMRIDKRTQSLHYFNAYAVKDRVDCSEDSTEHQQFPPTCDPQTILPNQDDHFQFFENCSILLGRILVKHIPILSSLSDATVWHIRHEQSQAMKETSIVVSLREDRLLTCVHT